LAQGIGQRKNQTLAFLISVISKIMRQGRNQPRIEDALAKRAGLFWRR
jgi:hypothetical protein